MFHYGRPSEVLPYSFGPQNALDYPARCVGELLNTDRVPENARALDIGCAVGRSSFELARHCKEVIGIDLSENFIRAAQELKENGSYSFQYPVSGTIAENGKAIIAEDIDRTRLSFSVGNAEEIDPGIGSFDIVLAANLLCRLNNPAAFLHRLPNLVKPGGQLLLTTPITWLESFTPKENWIGSTPEMGTTLDNLKKKLLPAFNLSFTKDMPFLIREHARKFQWSVAQASVWQRK